MKRDKLDVSGAAEAGNGASGDGAATFEGDLKRLEALVQELEDGDLALEASLERYEQGVALVRTLQGRLEQAKLRVQVLQDDGQLREAPELVPEE